MCAHLLLVHDTHMHAAHLLTFLTQTWAAGAGISGELPELCTKEEVRKHVLSVGGSSV